MTVDLSRPEGQQVFERLVAMSDGLIENNLPPNIEKQGITWERLSKINPRLVMVRIPASASKGRTARYRSMGHHMEAMAGHPAIRTYPDLSYEYVPLGVPVRCGVGHDGGVRVPHGLALSRPRRAKGLYDRAGDSRELRPADRRVRARLHDERQRLWSQMGNDHAWLAPHNVYACRGDDRWVTMAVRTEDEWRALCEVMYRPELSPIRASTSMAERHEHRRRAGRHIAAWTALRDAHWVERRLQRAGIPAGVVMTERDVFGTRISMRAGSSGRSSIPRPARSSTSRRPGERARRRSRYARHAPLLGEDNEYVYKELLGFSDEEYRRFEEVGHIGMDYDPSIA